MNDKNDATAGEDGSVAQNPSAIAHDGNRYETLAVKASHYLDLQTGAVVAPIHTATTYARDDRYRLLNAACAYSRDDSPSYPIAEQTLSDLENAEGCCLFSSGMAAISAVMRAFGSGANLILPESLYWGVFSWARRFAEKNDIRIHYYDNGHAESLQALLSDLKDQGIKPDLVWVETPSNPFLHITDIEAVASIVHQADSLLCVDSTAASPVLTRPLDLGADFVVHSATKYLNGHSDALCGAVLAREDNATWQSICEERHLSGAVAGNLESWLLSRGMRTLFLRVERASDNAMQIAEFLNAHENVVKVHYPGLPAHPGHGVASRQMGGRFGGLLSFEVSGGKENALAVAGALQLITSATSLGGVETLIEHRASVEPPETGVPGSLLRLAVGIEQVDDLLADLSQSLMQI